MTTETMRDLFGAAHPIIGMLHVPPLPGSPLWAGDMNAVEASVRRDARALADGGAHGLLVENFGDVPFHPGRAPAITIAHLTALAAMVRREFPALPLGINVLRNDGCGALAVAHAAGAQFVRVNVLCGARVADQGVLQGIAHDLMRDRRHLGPGRAGAIQVFADVEVKHSAPLARRHVADEVADTIGRGLADAVIVSGTGTGKATDLHHLMSVKAAARDVPVFVGSGASERTIDQYLPHADGFIVGTALKVGGLAENPVDVDRVRALVRRAG